MQGVTAIVCNGKIELNGLVDWPDGMQVEVKPVGDTAVGEDATESYRALMQRLADSFGDEPFERPEQGESETREEW